jgi:hypothetical protein
VCVQSDAEDYFIVRGAGFDWAGGVPPFVIGRVAYDNWLVDYAVHHFETVDATVTVKAVHQVSVGCAFGLSFVDSV